MTMIQKIVYSVFLCICNYWAHTFIMATPNQSLFLDFGATVKPCFESSHRSNIAVKDGIYGQLLISKTKILLTKMKSGVASLHG